MYYLCLKNKSCPHTFYAKGVGVQKCGSCNGPVNTVELDDYETSCWTEEIEEKGLQAVLPKIREQAGRRKLNVRHLESCINEVLGKDALKSLYNNQYPKALCHALALAFVKNIDRGGDVASTLLKANDELFIKGFVCGDWR